MTIEHNPGDRWIVTGEDRNGRRFRLSFDLPGMALHVNLWKGSVWRVRAGSNRRERVKRVG